MRAPALGLLAAAALAAATGTVATGAAAQADPGAPEGARRTVHVLRDFDSYDLPVGPFGMDNRAVRTVEGAAAWSAYRLEDPRASVAGVMQAYRERLAALGFETLLDCVGEACGGFDFRFEAEILPPPGMLVDVRDFAQLSVERDAPEGYVSVLVSRVLDTIHVETVSVAPADPPVEISPTAGEAPAGETPPEAASEPEGGAAAEAAPETAPDTAGGTVPAAALPQDESAVLARLMEEGHVPVEGLEFEVGGTALSPGSAEALDRLARLLARDEALSVVIVGHSDNQGPLDLNIDLSRQRADAVRRALIDRGVRAARLEARGVGYLAPVASNATEEGRARNRRVELVLR